MMMKMMQQPQGGPAPTAAAEPRHRHHDRCAKNVVQIFLFFKSEYEKMEIRDWIYVKLSTLNRWDFPYLLSM
jgi:hypothetical protein